MTWVPLSKERTAFSSKMGILMNEWWPWGQKITPWNDEIHCGNLKQGGELVIQSDNWCRRCQLCRLPTSLQQREHHEAEFRSLPGKNRGVDGGAGFFCSIGSSEKRMVCPSCSKRSILFGEKVREIVKPFPHLHVTFTIPKILRGYFRRNRKLLKLLIQSANFVVEQRWGQAVRQESWQEIESESLLLAKAVTTRRVPES